MKKLWIMIFLTAFVLNPAIVFAQMEEHEHSHAEHQGMAMHHEGGKAMHAEHAATLREAAAVLKGSHPDLAAKLEEMVRMHEEMHEGMAS